MPILVDATKLPTDRKERILRESAGFTYEVGKGRPQGNVWNNTRVAYLTSTPLPPMGQIENGLTGSQPAAQTGGEKAYNARKCLNVLFLSQFLTPFSVQAYAPTLPLLIGVGLGKPALIATLYSFFTVACISSFIVMGIALQKVTIRSLLLGAYSLRLIAGLVHCAGAIDLSSSDAFKLVICGRVMHGLTLATLSITNSWVGVRLPAEERRNVIAKAGAALMGGVTFGPSVAGFVASLFSTPEGAYSSPGLITTATSLLVLAAIKCNFDDTSMLPMPTKAAAANEPPLPTLKVSLMCLIVAGTNLGGLSTESFTGLILERLYGWEADNPRISSFWTPFGVSVLVGNIFFVGIQQKINYAPLHTIQAVLTAYFCWTMIPWTNFSSAVPPSVFTTGFSVWFMMGAFASTMAQATLTVVLPPSKQVAFQFINMMLAQVARAVGPILATLCFTTIDKWIETNQMQDFLNTISSPEPNGRVAANATMLLFVSMAFIFVYFVPLLFVGYLYGPLLPIFNENYAINEAINKRIRQGYQTMKADKDAEEAEASAAIMVLF